MKVPLHIIRLYLRTARKYNKVVSRLQRGTVSTYQRKTFLHKLKKLLRTLRELEGQLKIAAATGAVVLMLNTTPVQAQDVPTSTLGPFVRQNRTVNPLREPLFTGQDPAITAVDFDGDGDVDIVQGEYDYYSRGYLRYFQNQSTDGSPLYEELKGEDNPLNGIAAMTSGVAPAFADIDKDGDLDLFLGQNGWSNYYESSRGIEYYRNDEGTFTQQTGAWNETTKEGNPFDGVILGQDVRPVFVDFDTDGDLDAIIGSYTWTNYTSFYVHYYKNNGTGVFESSPLNFDNNPYVSSPISPAVADIDGDGDYDIVLGSYNYGGLLYYKQDTPGDFVRQFDAWDPVAKTGNPFSEFEVGANASPAFIDFNEDGLLDLFVADEESIYGYKYSDKIINYYKNSPGSVFTEIDGTENPFDGVVVKEYASPVLIDLDGDKELDALVGEKYYSSRWDYYTQSYIYTYSSISHYKKKDDFYNLSPVAENPFGAHQLEGYFEPTLADVDGDGDLDMISGAGNGQVAYYRNDGGEYVREFELNPFADVNVRTDAATELVDIDADADLDLFVTNSYGEFYYYRNDGNATDPEYALQAVENNPLAVADLRSVSFTTFLNFTDLDHDGDFDLLFNGGSTYSRQPKILYFENTGSPRAPIFDTAPVEALYSGAADIAPQLNLVDYDRDGDLDTFIGLANGTVSYFQNQNEIVQTTVTGTTVSYDPSKDAPVAVEPGLLLLDPDNDVLIQATVSIGSYQPGEVLRFTARDGISGVFDTNTGVLTFRGKGTVAIYQELLRSVTFEATSPTGRRAPSKNLIVGKNISFAVFDQDFTNPQVQVKIVQLFFNDPPSMQAGQIQLLSGAATTLDLKPLVSDPNGSADVDVTSIKVVAQPASGAAATVDANGILTINYTGLAFHGTETLTVEACDLAGACAQNVITVDVNAQPSVATALIRTSLGSSAMLDLKEIISDPDGTADIDLTSLRIVTGPASGAATTIDANGILNITYSGLTFHGAESVTVEACDFAGACAQNSITIEVNAPPVVATRTMNITLGSSTTLDLKQIISDPNGSADLDLASLKVVAQPASGATALVDGNGILTVNYNGLSFLGTETVTVEVCDKQGVCAQNSITVVVTNTPPVIDPQPLTTPAGTSKSINLMSITSDVDGNLNPDAFAVVQQPLSGATASINVVSPTVVNLLLDYKGITYSGTDQLTVKACDDAGACSENMIEVVVNVDDGAVVVYNAVAPNSTGDNKFMRITGLPQAHKVSIFNRWGDKVFESGNYHSAAFRGENTSGASLPSGTYYYTIEIPGEKMITGYLTLKQ